MASTSRSKKKSGSNRLSIDSGEKDRQIAELNNRIAVLEKSRNLIRDAPVGIYEIDFHGPRFNSVNDYMLEATGYTREELMAMNPFDLLDEESRIVFQERIGKQLAGERVDDLVEYWGRSKDGRKMCWLLKVAFTYVNGLPEGAIVVCQDITERKWVEKALRESEEKFHVLADAANTGILLVQGEDIVYINRALAEMGGYTVDECKHLKYWDVMPPDMREYIRWAGNARQRGWVGPSRSELRMVRKSGEEIWLDCTWAVPTLGGKPAVIVTCVDITERKRAEEALRESEEKFRLLAETSPAAIAIYQGDRFVYLNPAKVSMTGYRVDELMEMSPWDLVHPDQRDRAKKQVALRAQGIQPPSHYETKIIAKDGQERWIDNSTASFIYKNKPAGLLVATDITERMWAEEEVQNAKNMLKLIMDNIPQGIFWKDRNLVYQGCNRVVARDIGVNSTEDIVGKTDHDLPWPPGHAEGFREHDRKIMENGVPEYQIIETLRGTGREPSWIEINKIPLCDARGNVFGVLGTYEDITERMRAEEALRESEQKFRVLAETSPAAIFLYHDEKYLYVNPMAETLTGYTRDELLTDDAWGWIHPDFQDIMKEWARKRQIGERLPNRYEVKYRARDGRTGWVDFSAGLIEYEGKPAGLAMAFDVTAQKLIEEELLKAKAQAELYVDLMGHDINNMHQIALGYLELAEGMLSINDIQREFIEKPKEVLQRSARLIRNVRKLQKLEQGSFQAQDIDVCRVLVDVQHEYGSVPGKAVTLNTNGHEHCHVRANELLHDVFANLVGNAIKHTGDRADIAIDLDIVEDNDGRYCQVVVKDDGPGIPDDFKNVIFNRMLKGTDKAKGMGLGLYLVKSLVESYNGRVWVEDRVPGNHAKGARFVVMLPVAEQ